MLFFGHFIIGVTLLQSDTVWAFLCSASTALGHTYVLTDAYNFAFHRHCMSVRAVYDDYRVLLDKCDEFNRQL